MEWIAPLVLVAVVSWTAVKYNRLVRDRNRVAAGWSDIDVQLKRRHDLIPKLVEAVKQYAAYEQATLSAVTRLRAEAGNAASTGQRAVAERRLGEDLRRLVALAERYPDLKANESFLDLQRQITEVENHIQYARRYYNGAVRNLNTRIDTFPDNLVAALFRFRPAEYFDAGL